MRRRRPETKPHIFRSSGRWLMQWRMPVNGEERAVATYNLHDLIGQHEDELWHRIQAEDAEEARIPA